MEKVIPTVAQLQQKLIEAGYRFMYYEPHFDQEFRDHISVDSTTLTLAEQDVNAKYDELIQISAPESAEMFERILAGDALLFYREVPGSQ